jgi:hypothetical protein
MSITGKGSAGLDKQQDSLSEAALKMINSVSDPIPSDGLEIETDQNEKEEK